MPYVYDIFDGVDLPPLNQSQQLDPNGMSTALVKSIGGIFDQWGDSRADASPQVYRISGSYVGTLDYLVDETGDYLVDEVGDFLIAGSAVGSMRSQVADLRAKIRTRGSLWRVWQDDTTIREWKTARLNAINHTITYQGPLVAADVTCQFETSMAYWHAETVTTASVSAVASVAISLVVDNAGAQVDDAIITFTRTSGTITAVAISCDELGIDWSWAGSFGSGHVLTVDAGAQTVADGTTDAYSGFTLGAHSAAGWLTLPQGVYVFTVSVAGGNATVAINYYVQSD